MSSWDEKEEDSTKWELKNNEEEDDSKSSFGNYDSGEFYQVDRVNHKSPNEGGGGINFVGKKREL